MSYTKGWVCDVALIEYTLGSGETQEGLGIWKGGHKGPMGDKGSQFTSNLGLRWTIPITTGGCQVSRKGNSKGNSKQGEGIRHVQLYIVTRVRVYIEVTEMMKDTSCMYNNNNRNECC